MPDSKPSRPGVIWDQQQWQAEIITAGGRVRGIAVDPTNPDIVYIGAASGGLWKSIDGGTNWQNLSDNFACNTFGAIAIDPNNPNVVYAGTGEVVASGVYNIYDGRGLYKSTNGGVSWSQITNGFGEITQFADIEVSPHNSNIVFAALGNGYSHSNSFIANEGIWRSEDGGLTWTRTLVAQNSYNYNAAAYDVIAHPTDPNRVYAALGSSTPSGFYVSSDNGKTWTFSSSGLPTDFHRIQIALSPSAPATIYAAVFSTNFTPYHTQLFKSTTNGETWNQIAATTEFGAGGSDQGGYDLCIAVHPLDEKIVYVGNIEINSSTDGANFSYLNGNMHLDFHKIVFAPSNNDYIYVGCDGGVYRSTNGGSSFTSKNIGLSTLQLYMMASHPTNRDTIIAGSQDNGGFYTKNGGATYWTCNAGGDISGVFYDFLQPNTAYSVAYWRSLKKSNDGGITFFNNLGSNFDRNLEGFFLIHPTKLNWLYAAKDKKVIRSEDGGTSWTPISAELTKWPFYSMDQSFANPDIMILASWGINQDKPQVLVSSDEGYNWDEVTANFPDEARFISKVVTHPTEQNTLFVVRSGYGSGKIYRSTDLGATWKNISSNLPDIPHSDLFIDPENSDHYYTANDFGVYASFNRGLSWKRFCDGIPFVVANDLDYFYHGGDRLLRVATYGRGVYELNLNEVVFNEFAVAGALNYYSNLNPLANGSVALNELQQPSDSGGNFAFIDVPQDNYVLKPDKDDDLESSISAYDASIILRYRVGLLTLTPYQKIAADVTGNGEITSFDASYILRKVVGIIDEFPVGRDWKFVPENFAINDTNWSSAPDSLSYDPLNTNVFDQDFLGVVYGDVSGNWSAATGELTTIFKEQSGRGNIFWGEIKALSDNQKFVPLCAKIEGELFSAEIRICFDPAQIRIKQVQVGAASGDYLTEQKIEQNRLHIAIAATEPLRLSPDLLQLTYELLKSENKTLPAIEIESIKFNDGEIQSNIFEPRLNFGSSIPESFALFQSYPNPFNPIDTINYSLARDCRVKIVVYNTLG